VVQANRDFFADAGFDTVAGVTVGTKAQLSRKTATDGHGFWVTDEGDWNRKTAGPDGQLYVWTGGSWVLKYMPLTYPHPLRAANYSFSVPVVSTISFAGFDNTTQGAWQAAGYGTMGFALPFQTKPSWLSPNPYLQEFYFGPTAVDTANPRALQNRTTGMSAATFTVTLPLGVRRIALYMCDFAHQNLIQSIQVEADGSVLGKQIVQSFSDGLWLVYDVAPAAPVGTVFVFYLSKISVNDNPHISGIFLDSTSISPTPTPAPGSVSGASSAVLSWASLLAVAFALL